MILSKIIPEHKPGDLFNKAFEFAKKIHEGHLRRDGDARMGHSVAVAKKFRGNESLMTIAILHDCLEDCESYEDCLREILEEFPMHVSFSVQKLTRDKNMSYEDYIEDVSEDYFARMVKMEDIIDNLIDCKDSHCERYKKALEVLTSKK